jgi:RNA polymerase sigma-70 factor (ECF subfamily)
MSSDFSFESKEFFEDIANSVRNVIFDRFPNMSAQEREDIEQEVKLKIWSVVSRGKKIDNFRSYLWKAIYNTALNAINRRLPSCALEEVREPVDFQKTHHISASEPEVALEDREMKEIVRKAVKRLQDRRRTVVELHFIGMHRTEIAHFLNMSENQARHLLYRGLHDLADLVEPHLKGSSNLVLSKMILSQEVKPE